MTDDRDAERTVQVQVSGLAGVVERAAGDLGLGEEPARFLVALEEAAPFEPGP